MTDSVADAARLMKVIDAVILECVRQGVAETLASWVRPDRVGPGGDPCRGWRRDPLPDALDAAVIRTFAGRRR
jgi:hypothetical protein